MDNPNNNFSPEASRLTRVDQDCSQAKALDLADSWEINIADHIHRIDQTPYRATKEQSSALSPQHGSASWFSTFPVEPSSSENPRRKRAKYEDPKRRAEVAQLRKEGACMRCHLNKTPVWQIL